MTIEKLDQRIEELKQENAADRERLPALEREYENAVNSFQTDKINKLHEEMSKLKAALDNRVKQIAILVSPDNSIRKQAKEEQVKAIQQQHKAVTDKAEELRLKLQKAQEEYIKMANAVFEVNKEYSQAEKDYCRAKGVSFYAAPYLNPAAFTVSIREAQQSTGKPKSNPYFKGGIN